MELTKGCLYDLLYNNGMLLCCVVLRFYGPVNPMGSCRAVSLSNQTFAGQV